jgi:hypothetical protein
VFKRLSTTKDMTQPAPAGQLIGAAVTGLPETLKKILSTFVPEVLLNSVIGEQVAMAVVSEGPRCVAVSITPESIAVYQSAFTVTPPVVWVPHAYINPELFPDE